MVVDDTPPVNRTVDGRRTLWDIAPNLAADWPRPAEASRMVAHLLFQRGWDTPEKMRAFLTGLPPEHDPALLLDLEPAVARIRQAVANRENMAVWGDFDVDGLTATAIMLDALRMLGVEPQTIIPNRDDGHGLVTDRMARLADSGVTLLITVDCGIGDIEAVAAARQRSIDVIVTDHHQPPASGELPDAFVINPTLAGSEYPFHCLAGSGVAYKLARSLLKTPEAYEKLLDLVVLGTVADVVPLSDENRTLVSRGLERLRDTPRIGLQALMRVAGVKREALDCTAIGYFIAPRINAANRMNDPYVAFRLITTTDPDEAERLAGELDAFNNRRQEEVQLGVRTAIETTGPPILVKRSIEQGVMDPIICISGGWNPGISGLIASELTERYCVPAMVGSPREDGTISVSARSVRDVSVLEILRAAYDMNPSSFAGPGGGHAAACGFQTSAEKLEQAFAQLGAAARGRVPIDNLMPHLTVDAEVTLAQMNRDSMMTVESLEPYGHEFEAPLFMARRVCLSGKRTIGASGKHLALMAKSGNARVSAIIFNRDPEIADIPEDRPVDIVFNLRRSEYNGLFAPQLTIRDWRFSD
jgi:single-stranded-DNA-specific exonuclease